MKLASGPSPQACRLIIDASGDMVGALRGKNNAIAAMSSPVGERMPVFFAGQASADIFFAAEKVEQRREGRIADFGSGSALPLSGIAAFEKGPAGVLTFVCAVLDVGTTEWFEA